jgi:hypothetical protein
MALTRRMDGTTSASQVFASWWNDYLDLLSGIMKDQAVILRPNMLLRSSLTTPANITSATHITGSGLSVGTYQYQYTVLGPDGHESLPSTATSTSTTSGNQQVQITLPTQPTGTTGINIYRTKVGLSTPFYLIPGASNLSPTTTTYIDTTADTSLNTSITPPLEPRYNGVLVLQNGVGDPSNPADLLIIAADGSILSPGQDLYIKSNTNINFQSPNGTTVGQFNGGGLDLLTKNLTVNQSVSFHDYDGNAGALVASGAGIGFKKGSTKLAEVTGGGNMIISGTTYYTTRSTSPSFGTNGSFDGFDIAEVYQVDQEYASGTIVCPSDTVTPVPFVTDYSDYGKPVMSRCTHDGCSLAMVITSVPGVSLGSPNVPSMTDPAMPYHPDKPLAQCMSMTGRVFIQTDHDIPGKAYVTSDGTGGVRAVVPGEKVQAIGVSLSPTDSGMIPVMIRPMFVSL